MPSYTVVGPKGEEYEVNAPEGATKEQAFEFFKREYSAGRVKPKVGLGEKISTGSKQGFAGAGNTADIIGTLALNAPKGAQYLLGKAVNAIERAQGEKESPLPDFTESFDDLNRRIEQRNQWANPNKIDLGIPGSIAAGVTGLPSMLLAPASGLTTAKEFLDEGESLGRAMSAGAVDSALSTAGALIPGVGKTLLSKAAIGGAGNAAQGAITDAAVSAIAQKQETKDKFKWDDVNRRVTEAVLGAGFGAAQTTPKKRVKEPTPAEKLKALKDQEMATTEPDIGLELAKAKAADEATVARLEAALAKSNQPLPTISVDSSGRAAVTPDQIAQRSQEDFFRQRAEQMTAEAQAKEAPPEVIRAQMSDPFNPYPVAGDPASMEALTRAQQGVQYNQVPEGGVIPRDAQFFNGERDKPMLRVPRGNEWTVDENGIPVRQGLPETTVAPDYINKYMRQDKPARDDLGNAIQEANGPLLGDTPFGSERLAGPMEGPEPMNSGMSRGQRGAINMSMFQDNFQKTKTLPNGIRLVAQGSEDQQLRVKAYNSRNEWVGEAVFSPDDYANPTPFSNLESNITHIKEGNRRQGIASEIYQFASELGNDIFPSSARTPDGKAMWKGFEQSGIAKDGLIPRQSQRGVLNIGDMFKGDPEKLKKIGEMLKTPLFAETLSGEQVVAKALADGKDASSGLIKGPTVNLESGASMAALKRKSPLVLEASRIMQGFKNRADFDIRESVFPTEQALRKLSPKELTDLSEIFILEQNNRKKFTTQELADVGGLSEKQLLAYQKMREMFTTALEKTNQIREAQGLKPVTELDAYMSSRWQGDFRMPFVDSKGKLVWYLAANSKRSLKKQASELLARFPELTPGEMSVTKSLKRGGPDALSTYRTMLDVLGENDPAVDTIRQWAESQVVAEGRTTRAQEKHFEPKGNIRGFIGDRPWKDSKAEALEFFQQQIQYAKNAHQWAAMQKASKEFKTILTDKDLQNQQPNNLQYLREYFLDNIGANESNLTRAFEDLIRSKTGVSPNAIGSGIGAVKNYWVTSKLAANLGFMISNAIQAGNILPHLTMMQKEFGGNMVSALTMGPALGLVMASGHMAKTGLPDFQGNKFYQKLAQLPGYTEFHAKAMKFAEDNSVVARSIYDESPIETSFSTAAKVSKAAGTTITFPETILRAITYMTYVEQLKSSGKFKNDLDLFRTAEERTNVSMGDYREGERPMIFNQMGNTGNALNVLQTFAFNFYNQYSTFGREAAKGNPLPLITMLATHGFMAGLMGVPGFAEADKLIEWVKEYTASEYPTLWNKIKNINLKQMVLELPGGEHAFYGGLSTMSGLGLTSRAAAPIPSEMVTSPGAPIIDLGKQLYDVGNLMFDPLNERKQAQAAMSVAPAGLQGLLETTVFRNQTSVPDEKGRTYGKPKDIGAYEGQYTRTPEEESLRAKGLRSQKEVVTREQNWQLSKAENQAKAARASLPNSIHRDLVEGKVDSARDKIKLYAEISGNEFSSRQLENEIFKRYTTPDQRLISSKGVTLDGLLAYKRMKTILQEMGYENAN